LGSSISLPYSLKVGEELGANNTTPGFLKTADAEISLPYSGKAIEKYDMRFYFGPNSYPTLREYGKDIERKELLFVSHPFHACR